ncbi:hypothetical protein D9M70_374930 [compost metagenome]
MLGAGDHQGGFGQLAAGPGLDRPAIERGGFAIADEALAGEGLVHQAQRRAAAVVERDQGAPQRNAADEGARAIHRVQHPGPGLLALDILLLLAEHAVAGEALADQRPHGALGALVRQGHGVEAFRLLVLHLQRQAEVSQGDPGCRIGQFFGELKKIGGEGVLVHGGSGSQVNQQNSSIGQAPSTPRLPAKRRPVARAGRARWLRLLQ